MSNDTATAPLPAEFIALKKEIAAATPDFASKITKAWKEIVEELALRTEEISKAGSAVSVYDVCRRRD